MSNGNQTPEQAFHYRTAICCKNCPANTKTLVGFCTRLKIPVEDTGVCDKHPGWKQIFHGKGGSQQ